MYEPTAERKKALLEQEIAIWENTLYRDTLRHRVQKVTGASPDVLKAYATEVERDVKILDALAVEMKEVEKQLKKEQEKEQEDVQPAVD